MITTSESKPEIFKAIVAAQRAAKAVEKGSRNDFHKYKYASAEAMISEAREALSEAGLALMTTGWVVEGDHIHVSYMLVHELGQSLMFSASTALVVEKGRPADKAEATALTYNLGYFLRGLLLLPRVEEGTDVDQRDDREKDPLASLKMEFSKLRYAMTEEARQIVDEGMKRKGFTHGSLVAANKYMSDILAANPVKDEDNVPY